MDAKKKREVLKVRRNRLFENYLNNPSDTHLALEIKEIDDEIALSLESESRATAIRR